MLTDHLALKWLKKMDNPSGRLARWAMELSQWEFEVKYRKGTDNLVADALSRQPAVTCAVRRNPNEDWYQRRLRDVKNDPTANTEYRICSGRLFRRILHTLDFNECGPEEEWKVCVPTKEQQRVLKEVHDSPTAGHQGIAKTLSRLSRLYYWPGMLRMGAKHVRNCLSCQKYKLQQQVPAGQMHATNVEQPWEMVSVEIIGLLPRSNSGNTWLLVAQDRFPSGSSSDHSGRPPARL